MESKPHSVVERILTRLEQSIRLPGLNDRQMPPSAAAAHLQGSVLRKSLSLLSIRSFAFTGMLYRGLERASIPDKGSSKP